MGAAEPSYEVVSLPDGIPECLRRRESSEQLARSSFNFAAGKRSDSSTAKAAVLRGFHPGKALKGAGRNTDEEASACRTRGDGLFEGGKSMRQEGNRVIMAPSAFSSGENMERTMAEMEEFDRRQAEARRRPPPPAAAKPISKIADEKNMSSLDPREVKGIFDLLQMADGGLVPQTPAPAARVDSDPLFDISEDSSADTSEQTGKGFAFALPAQQPVHRVVRKAASERHPYEHLQIDIELPKLESAAEADVKIGKRELSLSAASLYRLKLSLPCSVRDEESGAKWSKAKRKLTLTLPVDM